MAAAQTASYDEVVLEVEFVAGSGTYSPVCGITGATVTRSAAVTTTEIPDCDDATKPHETKKGVRALDVSVSGTGVWARQSHKNMVNWFYSGLPLNVRIRNRNVEVNGATDDPYIESGPALLSTLTNERPGDKGEMTASIELQFDGTPTLGLVT